MIRRLSMTVLATAALVALTGCAGTASPEQQAVDVTQKAATDPYAASPDWLCEGSDMGWNEESMGEWTDVEVGEAEDVELRDDSYLVPVSWSHDGGATSYLFWVDAEEMCVSATSQP